jgi:hypothetical protein
LFPGIDEVVGPIHRGLSILSDPRWRTTFPAIPIHAHPVAGSLRRRARRSSPTDRGRDGPS